MARYVRNLTRSIRNSSFRGSPEKIKRPPVPVPAKVENRRSSMKVHSPRGPQRYCAKDGTRPYFLKDTETPVVCQFQPSLKCRPPLYRESAAFQTGSNSWFYDGVHFPYGLMIGIRQGLLNLFAIALYHAFEQQIMLFHRKNVLQVEEENDDKLFKMSEFQHRLEEFDIKITEFASWPKIDELRLLANAVTTCPGKLVT